MKISIFAITALLGVANAIQENSFFATNARRVLSSDKFAPTNNFGPNYNLRDKDMEPQQKLGMALGLIVYLGFLLFTLFALVKDYKDTDTQYNKDVDTAEATLLRDF